MRQLESLVTDSHLAFLHGFQQGALYLGRSTVNFIRQYEVGEYRTLLHLEAFVFLAVYHGTDDIGRQQVRRKLNTAVLRVNQRCKGFDCQCLCQSRHTFQQHMTVGKQTDQQGFYQMFLTDDDLVHACRKVGDESTLSFNPLVQFADINSFSHKICIFKV